MGKMTGDWNKLRKYVKALAPRAKDRIETLIDRSLEQVSVEAKREIRANEITPASNNKSGITLIDSGEYVRHIGVYRNKRNNSYVGLPPGMSPHGMQWLELWTWLRYGTANSPARAHIDTAFERSIRKIIPRVMGRDFIIKRTTGRALPMGNQ